MKKLFTILCFIFAALTSSFAEDVSIFSDIPGSYAVYHDLRFGEEAFIGICYAGNDTLIARSYEVKKGNELILSVKLELKDGNINLGQELNWMFRLTV